MSWEIGLAAGAALLLASALGFAGGWYSALARQRRDTESSRASASRLVETIIAGLHQARRQCALVEMFADEPISETQSQALERGRGGLVEAIGRLLARGGPSAGRARQAVLTSGRPWVRNPRDPVTGLPASTTLGANLQVLVDRAAANGAAALVVARVDKHAALAKRFGQPGADRLLGKLAQVVIQCLEDQDLVCRASTDVLAILLPACELADGLRAARLIRNAVRDARFHPHENGPQVLLTASFGITTWAPGDRPASLWTRAEEAAARSARQGRNQVHFHDGASLIAYR